MGIIHPQSDDVSCSSCMFSNPISRYQSKQAGSNGGTFPLEVIHIDSMGPITPPGVEGSKYIFNILDDFTNFHWTFNIQSLPEVATILKQFILQVNNTNKHNSTVKYLRSDHGTESLNTDLEQFLVDKGIVRQLSVPHAHYQNGAIEASNRVLQQITRNLLADALAPEFLWPYAIRHATLLCNIRPLAKNGSTPFANWFCLEFDHSLLRVWGCCAYAAMPLLPKLRKFFPRNKICVFLGLAPAHKAFLLLDLTSNKVFTSTRVRFDEYFFPFEKFPIASISKSTTLGYFGGVSLLIPATTVPPLDVDLSDSPIEEDPPPADFLVSPSNPAPGGFTVFPLEVPTDLVPPIEQFLSTVHQDLLPKSQPPESPSIQVEVFPHDTTALDDLMEQDFNAPTVEEAPSPVVAPTGPPAAPPVLNLMDSTSQLASHPPSSQALVPSKSALVPSSTAPVILRTRRPRDDDLSPPTEQPISKRGRGHDGFSRIYNPSNSMELVPFSSDAAFLVQPNHVPLFNYCFHVTGDVPSTFADIPRSTTPDAWYAACRDEIQALEGNNTWIIADLPPTRRPITSKWVFSRKSDGRYKARIVARGFTQIAGIDYTSTFSPVISYPSLRILLGLSASLGHHLHCLDVSNAFTQAPLTESIYMTAPPGLNLPKQKALLLQKSLYGLKQLSFCWNSELHATLVAMKFVLLPSEPCIYVGTLARCNFFIGVYVDDLILSCSSVDAIARFKSSFMAAYRSRDLGPISTFLGLNIIQSREGITLNGSDYIKKILREFNLDHVSSNSVSTPMPPGYRPEKLLDNDELADATLYRSIIGKLLYLAHTCRPDLAFPANLLARFLQTPKQSHLQAAKRMLRYLIGTLDLGIHYSKSSSSDSAFTLDGYSDSTWADDTLDRHSTSAYIFIFANGPILWRLHKQKTVATSSTESELYSLCDAAKEMLWLKQVFDQLKINLVKTIFCDNIGAIAVAEHQTGHSRLKHVEIQNLFIRQHVNVDFQLKYINTKLMKADCLTKALSAPTLKTQLNLLNLR